MELKTDPMTPAMRQEFDAVLSVATDGLIAQRARLAEDFLLSGAFPRDLCLVLGPIQCVKAAMSGGDHIFQVSQPVRMA